MSGRIPGHDGPEDVDAAFAEIVADLEREGGLRWPEEAADGTATTADTAVELARAAPDRGEQDPEALEDDPDDHYVPPEPPPFPPLRAPTIGALLLLTAGVVLLVAPSLIGLAHRVATPLALIALTCGIGWLVLRMRQDPPADSGWDDGAQV
ncbi:hypothetical protein GCM10012275_35620 [Longimycelium tulufanense]|uniref:DUF308 domain-containing protein n=1 Tax=Longimycelium tulufanense TaxID=907463 RepID=A0A8J3CFN3_9PSEU|nr:hypothetical protein [Longimycelium tulufanense]GGM61485.1 hypothetical protein GCM10012275_35620 [Longimycelium tulufanense]